jgi:hypothetical protein
MRIIIAVVAIVFYYVWFFHTDFSDALTIRLCLNRGACSDFYVAIVLFVLPIVISAFCALFRQGVIRAEVRYQVVSELSDIALREMARRSR